MTEVNVLALVKDDERYLFIYDDAHRQEILKTLGRYAGNPELSFNWQDEGRLRKKVFRLKQQSNSRKNLEQQKLKNRITKHFNSGM